MESNEAELRSELGFVVAERGRENEPNPMKRETSSLLRQVFASLRESGVTPSRVAEQLGITPSELNGLVFGLVPTAIAGSSSSPCRLGGKPKLRLVE